MFNPRSAVLGALLGRYFWIPALAALGLGFLVPGDYRRWDWTVPVLLGGILFFSCLNVQLEQVYKSLSDRRLLSRLALLSSLKLVVLPLTAWALTALLAPAWAPGVLLVSAMPAGLSSIAFTDLNGGNRVLALFFVLVTSVLCPLTVPVLLDWQGPSSDASLGAFALAGRAGYILMVLFVPFASAQLVRRSFANLIDRQPLWWTRAAILCTCLLVFASVAINRNSWVGWGLWQFVTPLSLTFLASGLFVGAASVARKRLGHRDSVAFACGVVYMNNGLAVVLAVRFFPNNGRMLLPAVLMQVPMLVMMAIIAEFATRAVRRSGPAAPAQSRPIGRR